MLLVENRRFHQVPVVSSIKHENENYRGGLHVSEWRVDELEDFFLHKLTMVSENQSS